MKKANLMMAAVMAAAMYAINPYTGLTKLQEIALMAAYMIIGTMISVICGLIAGEILDRRKRKKFRRMIRQTTL